MRPITFLFGMAAAAFISSNVTAATLFSDGFNSPTSAANYTQTTTGVNSAIYGWDYGTMGIPSAPSNPGNSTLGLRLASNDAQSGGTGTASGITLHTVQSFTGAYRVKFDMWMNANGPFPTPANPGDPWPLQGGTGSTEFLTAGVGGNGTTTNAGFGTATGSGAWTSVSGEGGSGIDYRLYKGTVLQAPSSGQYDAGTVDSPTASNSRNANNVYYSQFGNVDVSNLPVQGANNGGPAQQNGETKPGSIAFEWHEVLLEVDPTGGTNGSPAVSWSIDGLSIGTFDAGVTTSFSPNGRVTLGYYDPFSGRSDNVNLSFAVIDNLQVLPPVPEPSAMVLCLIAAAGWIGTRRRSWA